MTPDGYSGIDDASDDQARIRDQIAFYREQARQHRPIEDDDALQHLLRSYWDDPGVQQLVRSYCPPSARGLELASGAGRWTGALLGVCQRITAVDTSAEMHEINRSRHGDARIEYVVADLFEYRPDGLYDLIFAGFWLSHVPPGRFQPFWSMLRDALAPGGHVVMVDDGVRGADGTPSGSPMIPPAGETTADCQTAANSRLSRWPMRRRTYKPTWPTSGGAPR